MDECVSPEGGRRAIAIDFHMLVMFSGKERTETQRAALLKSADERFVIERVCGVKRGDTRIIEVRLV